MSDANRVVVSVSGGETSALMAYILKTALAGATHELVFVFANTGEEDWRTLTFLDRCDREWGLGLVWVEARVNPIKGQATSFERVTFETASRCGAPFRDVIAKYGLPGPGYPHCNRELKLAPIAAFAHSLGWPSGTYQTAVGIRADEIDRMTPGARRYRVTYPLVGLGVTKADVIAFWEKQPFRLGIPEHYGNCVWCWKKSARKLMTLAKERPEAFDFPREMERRYSTRRLDGRMEDPPRRLFRGRKTVDDIFREADLGFNKFVDPRYDEPGGCGESCEVFADYDDASDLI